MPENADRRVNYALVKIITENIEIEPAGFTEDKPVKLNVGLNFGLDPKQHLLKVLFKNEFLQEESPFITIETSCIFAIDPDSWNLFANMESGEFVLPRVFAGHLASLTASTTRGILHERTDSTPMNRFFIPANNIEEMIKENVILPIEPLN
ncbi:MAG: hypothetical protein HGA62_09295 [Chlorobiaceae bacterium]|nr:hypothetical protein [Chlorobiaceae bacterium]NTV60665.1 hypothetical protein [Chlorobiaceae bacterium]